MNRREKMIKNKYEETVMLDDGTEVKVYVKQPDNESIKSADRHRAKAWNLAFQDGVLTRKEVETMMEERGIWDSEKASKEEQITKEIVDLEKKLYRGNGKKKPKLSEGRELAVQMRQKRLELRELISERIAMDENTAEALAENARFDYLVSCCCFYSENDEPVFEDYEDFSEKSSTSLATAAASMLAKMMYNLDSDFEKNLPENKFLRKFDLVNEDGLLVDPNNKAILVDAEGRRLDQEGYYVDEKGNRVDKDGNPVNDEGIYELIDYENDLVKSTPKKSATPRKKPATRRKTKKVAEKSVE